MNKQKKYRVCLCLFFCVLILTACKKNDMEDDAYELYYVNTQATALEQEKCQIDGDTTEKQIESMLKTLKKNPEDVEKMSAFPEGVKVEKWELISGRLEISFNDRYKKVEKVPELLFRASMVQSLIQIDGVNSVKFYIGDEPLQDSQGNDIGAMNADDFVQNTGSTLHTYQGADLELFFSDSAGEKLEVEKDYVRYNSNILKEKLIVEQLMRGPSGEEHKKVIPPDTVLIGVSVKDDICYVNFDNGFLNIIDVQPEVTIYSIVNSIIRSGSASQVQILINGDSNLKYQDTVDLSKPLSEREDIVKES